MQAQTVTYALIAVVTLLAAAAALFNYVIVLPRQPMRAAPPPFDAAETELSERLRRHIAAIASEPHNVAHHSALDAAARYIEGELRRHGLSPSADGYEADGRAVRNIEVVIGPPHDADDIETYVVGAHYDSHDDSPGANDNASGVAALIEIARRLGPRPGLRHRLRIVFFVNEEQPYGQTELMGSWRHARRLHASGETVAGMMALETIGYFSSEPGSQRFPKPFDIIYSDIGNFVAFVGLPGSRRFLHRAVRTFRARTPFPAIGGVVPDFIEGADLSDHWSYRRFGFPALMVTDTAPFRNPRYHDTDDLPETVDCLSLARITAGLELTLRDLLG